MNKSTIEWCDYTVNPQTGCKNNCFYCYARKLHNKRHLAYQEGKKLPVQYAKPYNELQWFPQRLSSFNKVKLPKQRNRIAKLISPNKPLVFVGSMGDLFAENIPGQWINKTMDAVRSNPHCEFMFLTKNPWRYNAISNIPSNAWLGCTVNSNKDEYRLSALYVLSKFYKTFVSIEPILGKCDNLQLSFLDIVLVGAMTGKNSIKPQIKWIESLNKGNIYYKDNIIRF